MSKAYRKWKEDIKAYRRGELPECEHDYILLTDTSMAAYKRIRRVRQREMKRFKKTHILLERFKGLQFRVPEFPCRNPYQQVPEEECIRQANEYWRQNEPGL